MNTTLLASYLVQASGALTTAAIFGGFYREYRRTFLRDWAVAWLALSGMLAIAGAAQLFDASIPVGSPSRVITAAFSCAMGYIAVAWLRFGSAALSEGTNYSKSTRITYSLIALLVGITLASIHPTDPGGYEIRFLLREGMRNLVVGIVFIVSALQVWRSAGVHKIGRRIVVWAFILFGASRIALAWLGLFVLPGTIRPGQTLFIGFSEFVLLFTMGLGVVIWLLEEQHASAQVNAAKVEQLAFRDVLTGLPNRKLFLDHLDLAVPQARRAKHKLAVFFIDVDRFKIVNDSLGHSVGDKVLQVMASRIRTTLRETDTVARMGGDEFTVLAPVVHSIEDAIVVARKVHEAIKEPIAIEGRELFITVSVGISIFPDDGADAEALLRAADTAMYRAKAQGADLFQLYTSEMNTHAIQQLALESALRRGVESLEFSLHYQPIVRTRDGSVHAMEAMLRWKHPVLGLVHPEQFIRLAESTGMIVPIGEWAMRTACRQLALWRAEGFLDPRIAVNMSTRQIQQPGLVDFVRGVLKRPTSPPRRWSLRSTKRAPPNPVSMRCSSCARSRRWGCTSPSTTSAPAIRRSRRSVHFLWTCSRSIPASCATSCAIPTTPRLPSPSSPSPNRSGFAWWPKGWSSPRSSTSSTCRGASSGRATSAALP